MSVDYDNLRAFVLASAKMHLSNRYATSVLRRRVDFLEDMLGRDGALSEDAKKALQDTRQPLEEAFDDLSSQTDALLSALERFARG